MRQGHQVTLLANGDSVTTAHLVAACHRALRLDHHCIDHLAHHITILERVYRDSHQFDIIHFHTDYLHFLQFQQI